MLMPVASVSLSTSVPTLDCKCVLCSGAMFGAQYFGTRSHTSLTTIICENAVNSSLENFLMANKLSLNVAKTEFMLIGSRQMIKDHHPTFFLLKTNKLNKLINAKLLI